MATKYQTRSISLPSKSHPNTIKLEQDQNRLKTWEASSQSTSGSMCIGLSELEKLYNSLDDLLNLGSTQEELSRHQDQKYLDELLDGSLKLLDICGAIRDLLFRFKEQIRALESSLRRRKSDSSIENDVNGYISFRRKMKKEVKKLAAVVLKQMENHDQGFSVVIGVIIEVNSINFSVFKSLLLYLNASMLIKPRKSKWLLVSKLVQKGVVACEEKQENVNELEKIDAALNEGLDNQNIVKRLEALDMSIEELESCLECVFRRLIKTRASILNIISE